MSIPWWGYVILAGLAWGTYVPIVFFGGQVLSPADPKSIGGRLASILCVGVAYFVLAVLIPLALMATRDDTTANWKSTGLVFSGLAGVMGAVGAICVIFASKSATDEARREFNQGLVATFPELKPAESEPAPTDDPFARRSKSLTAKINAETDPAKKEELQGELAAFRAEQRQYLASYRMFIAPLIFCLAPLINTLLSLVWHPHKDEKTGEWVWNSFHLEFPSWHLPLGIVFVAVGTFLVLYSKESGEAKKLGKPATQMKAKPAA